MALSRVKPIRFDVSVGSDSEVGRRNHDFFPQQQTLLTPAVTSEKCQSTKSLRDSPLRG